MLKASKYLIVISTLVLMTASLATAQTTAQQSQAAITARLQELQKQLAELQVAAAATQAAGQRGAQAPAPAQQGGRGQAPAPATPAQNQNMPGMNMPAGPTGGDANNPEGNPVDSTDPQALLNRIKLLEQRIKELETIAVLSDPETRVRKKEVYVDKNGVEYDQPTPGAKKVVTYERERVYRRNNINEKIEEALTDAEEHHVQVGVNAGIVSQLAHRTAPFTLVGGTVTIVSGMALYTALPEQLTANPAFMFKIAALTAALVNAWWFHAVLARRIAEWDTAAMPPALVQASGYVSLCLWIALIVSGRLIAFV